MKAQSSSHSVCLEGYTGTRCPLPGNTSLPTCSTLGGAYVPHLTLLGVANLFDKCAQRHWRRPRVRARETGDFRPLICIERIDVADAETPIISRFAMRLRYTAMKSMGYEAQK